METGSTVFTKIINEPFYSSATGGSFCGTAGDYDKDGDLDLFVSAASEAKGLYKNDLSNGNGWVNLQLEGNPSNRSAIGAVVKAKAIINGSSVWQMRSVNAQNTFNGMNSLNVEFGFGNGTLIDSLIILWPSGNKDIHTQIALNQFYSAKEGSALAPVGIYEDGEKINVWFEVSPNPANSYCRVRVVPGKQVHGKISITDISGRLRIVLFEGDLSAQPYEFGFSVDSLPPGSYICLLDYAGVISSRKLIVAR